jgi:hypothetical protein
MRFTFLIDRKGAERPILSVRTAFVANLRGVKFQIVHSMTSYVKQQEQTKLRMRWTGTLEQVTTRGIPCVVSVEDLRGPERTEVLVGFGDVGGATSTTEPS